MSAAYSVKILFLVPWLSKGWALTASQTGLGLIEASEQDGKKGHVIAQGHLPQETVLFLQLPADPAVEGMIYIKLLKLHLGFVHNDISEHSHPPCSIPAVLNFLIKLSQLFLINSFPHFLQWTAILPFPLGTLSFCPHLGHL